MLFSSRVTGAQQSRYRRLGSPQAGCWTHSPALVTWKRDSRDDSGRKWEAPHGPQDTAEVTVLFGRGGPALATCYGDLHLSNATDLRTVAETLSGLIQQQIWRQFSLLTISMMFIKTGNILCKNCSSNSVGSLTKTDVCLT